LIKLGLRMKRDLKLIKLNVVLRCLSLRKFADIVSVTSIIILINYHLQDSIVRKEY
jgi:hypothetical protein